MLSLFHPKTTTIFCSIDPPGFKLMSASLYIIRDTGVKFSSHVIPMPDIGLILYQGNISNCAGVLKCTTSESLGSLPQNIHQIWPHSRCDYRPTAPVPVMVGTACYMYVWDRLPLPHDHLVGPGLRRQGLSRGQTTGRGSKTLLSLPSGQHYVRSHTLSGDRIRLHYPRIKIWA